MNLISYINVIIYLIYTSIFISVIFVVRHLYYAKVHGISPKDLNRMLKEKGISRFKLIISPLIGKYYVLSVRSA